MYLLFPTFLLVALVYSMVGFGGGSSYSALLVLSGANLEDVPFISLFCNLVVVSGSVWRYSNRGQLPWRKAWPLIAASVPMAWIGGRLPLPETVFLGVLGTTLLISGLLLLAVPRPRTLRSVSRYWPAGEFAAGGALGLVAGISGIGGGIFLAPLLHLIGWAQAKQIAATCAAFILLNSASGLLGQIVKRASIGDPGLVVSYWPLALAVFVGGQLGSHVGSGPVGDVWIRRLTALLVLYAALVILRRFWMAI